MLSSLNKIFQTILLLSLFALFCSCTSRKSEETNDVFLKQYGSDIERINSRREEMNISNQKTKSDKNWKDPKEIFNIDNAESSRSAFIDTSQIVMPKPPEDFSPNVNTLLQGQGAQLPEDMFAVSYNLQNFPNSYGRPRLSFDDIAIPSHDAFGIETELGEKNYQLISHKTLQRDIDFNKQLISKEDREISAQLILEEKQAGRKRYLDQHNSNKTTDDKKAEGKIAEKKDDGKIAGKKVDDKLTPPTVPSDVTKINDGASPQVPAITNQTSKQQ